MHSVEEKANQDDAAIIQAERLSEKAFGSVAVPTRESKPRRRGQTIVADKGLGTYATQDLLEIAGDYIDWVKLAGSSVRLLDSEVLGEKIARYHERDVSVLVAGDVLELALRQGRIEQIWQEVSDRECQGVEVAAAQIALSLEDQVDLVRQATGHGLDVFAEVGRKGESGVRHHPGWIARQIDALLDAGAYRVVLQGEGVTEDVAEMDSALIFGLAAQVDTNRIVWQAKNQRSQIWLIRELGPGINLDVETDQALMLEARRRGIRDRGTFGVTATADRTGRK